MEKPSRILDGAVEESQFAADNDTTTRTLARYRNQPDGIPYFVWSGRIYYDVAAAREWLRSRMKRRNSGRARRRVTAAA